jgi:EAL domain-containing protein (putative c-di-GMP-specific phosphodiesterase class I)/GGDEF domain-containing protein
MGRLAKQEILLPNDVSTERIKNRLKASRDPLTNAFVNSAFHEEVTRRQQTTVNISNNFMVCIQLTNLDKIRDMFDVTTADQMVLELTSRLRSCFSKQGGAVIGRIESTGLFAYLYDCKKLQDATALSDSLETCITGPVTTSLGDIVPTLKMAVIRCDGMQKTAAEICQSAKLCVQTLPDVKGFTCQIVSNDILEMMDRRIQLCRELQTAMEQDALHMEYQPQVRTTDHIVIGMEALLRWQHPILGRVSPLEILDAARDVNSLVALENWVIRRVCQQIKSWQDSELPVASVSVNVSGETLLSEGFESFLSDCLSEYALSASIIDLEIVESAIISDFDRAVSVMRSLSEKGVRFSLDDFGTGFSSLSYLRQLPINTLKIDKSFVDEIIDCQQAATLCASIISMGKSLDLHIVAEGIEYENQSLVLKAMRCDYLQGYYFSKPIPNDVIAETILCTPLNAANI